VWKPPYCGWSLHWVSLPQRVRHDNRQQLPEWIWHAREAAHAVVPSLREALSQ